MTTRELVTLLGGRPIGAVERGRNGRQMPKRRWPHAIGHRRATTHALEPRGRRRLQSTERIVPHADGRSFSMRGERRHLFGGAESYQASGRIDKSAAAATYEIPWQGTRMVQRTRVVAEGLKLELVTAFSRARVRLRRDGHG